MKNKIKIVTALAYCLLFAVPNIAVGQGLISSADILSPFACDPVDRVDCQVIGTSTLYRTSEGVGINIYATDLPANTPLTVWIVVFNNPNHCAAFPKGVCGFGDLGNPMVNATIFWATGNYTDPGGNGYFQAYVTKGVNDRIQLVPGELVNPAKAEIHFIYRAHPIVFGEEWASINTPGGACPGGVENENPAPDQCYDVGFSIHVR